MELVERLRSKSTDCHESEGPLYLEAANEIERLQGLVLRLRLEAQAHSHEARAANSTIAEAYQVVSGARGEPGNWNGANPIRGEISILRKTLKEARQFIDEHCMAPEANSIIRTIDAVVA